MGPRTQDQTEILIDGLSFVLAASVDLDAVQREVERAIETPGQFVRFTAAGNRRVRVLITPTSRVTFVTEDVAVSSSDPVMSRNDEGDWDFL
ncbi:hypothetical protein RAC69_01960 [Microbacterium sp. LS_15]|uniref:hypothetical protein n=1 Tax=Microbacterium sp. LS_15 TaxID=3055790 RepID=UPI0035C13E0A